MAGSKTALSWLAALAVLLSARAARAEPVPVATVGLRYDAPESCPTADTFIAGVNARTSRVRFVREGGAVSQTFVVSISVTGSAAKGRILTIEPDGRATSQRVFRGATCAEVVDAVALVAALAVDPDASMAGSPTPEPPSTPHEPAPSPPPASPLGPPEPEDRRVWADVFLGAAETAAFGFAPLARGGDLFVGVRLSRRGLPVWLAPELRAGFRGAGSISVHDASGTASFAWLLGALEVSPIRVPLGPLVGAVGAFFDAGSLRAAGSGPTNAKTVDRPWLDAGVLARLELDVSSRWLVALGGGPVFPLRRDYFYFAAPAGSSAATVERIQPVGARLDFTASFRFR